MGPMPPEQYPGMPPQRADNTTLFGVLGIVLAICFWPAGLVFSILAMNSAGRVGKPKTLGIIGLVLSVIAIEISAPPALYTVTWMPASGRPVDWSVTVPDSTV